MSAERNEEFFGKPGGFALSEDDRQIAIMLMGWIMGKADTEDEGHVIRLSARIARSLGCDHPMVLAALEKGEK